MRTHGNERRSHRCECCGEPATRQDRDGVWLCEGDYNHLLDHWLIEEAANG